jgi:hypothetical protein
MTKIDTIQDGGLYRLSLSGREKTTNYGWFTQSEAAEMGDRIRATYKEFRAKNVQLKSCTVKIGDDPAFEVPSGFPVETYCAKGFGLTQANMVSMASHLQSEIDSGEVMEDKIEI